MITTATERLRTALGSTVDPASLIAFRVGFGLLAAGAAVRFVALGWVEALYLAPSFHFAWASWAQVPPAPVMYGLFVVQALAGLGVALGWRVRACLGGWLASFCYVELLDKALYLNHYVLFTLLGVTLLLSPVARWERPGRAWALWLLRAEVGLVYLWAGLCKLNGDWLLRAEPLSTWLGARADLPVIGPVLDEPGVAFAMSWGGALYDLAIVWLLLWRPTRPLGFLLVVGFHVTVGLLFPLGVFPWVMVLGATLFLEPGWPRRWVRRPVSLAAQPPVSLLGAVMWCGVVSLLALFPARFLLWGTDVSWTERGYRFAWRVLLNEKTGMVDFRVVAEDGRVWRVMPGEELTVIQHAQMRTQPDMIRDYALHLAARHEGTVAVYADAWASLNGRPSQRLIDPEVDLTQPLSALEAAGWIVPLDSGEGRL